MNTKLQKQLIAAGAIIIAALIGAAGVIVGAILENQDNFSLKEENSALIGENTSLKKANSSLLEENSALKENISKLEMTDEQSEDKSASSINIDTNNYDNLIDQNLDPILEMKAQYIYSDTCQFKDDSLSFRINEKAGYVYRNIGNENFTNSLEGKSLSSIRVFFLDYETDNVICTLVSDERGCLQYYSEDNRVFYCVVISPEYELYVSPPLQMNTGKELPFFYITLDKLDCEFSPLFKIRVHARDSSQLDQSYTLFPHASIAFRCINVYSDPALTNNTYITETNDSGILDFNGCNFSLNTNYVLDIVLYAEHISSDENDSSYESPSQTVDGSISNTNIIDVYLEYDGSIVSLQEISK